MSEGIYEFTVKPSQAVKVLADLEDRGFESFQSGMRTQSFYDEGGTEWRGGDYEVRVHDGTFVGGPKTVVTVYDTRLTRVKPRISQND
jgi:hypothetical protein